MKLFDWLELILLPITKGPLKLTMIFTLAGAVSSFGFSFLQDPHYEAYGILGIGPNYLPKTLTSQIQDSHPATNSYHAYLQSLIDRALANHLRHCQSNVEIESTTSPNKQLDVKFNTQWEQATTIRITATTSTATSAYQHALAALDFTVRRLEQERRHQLEAAQSALQDQFISLFGANSRRGKVPTTPYSGLQGDSQSELVRELSNLTIALALSHIPAVAILTDPVLPTGASSPRHWIWAAWGGICGPILGAAVVAFQLLRRQLHWTPARLAKVLGTDFLGEI